VHYYNHHIGDYMRDTAHLTLVEDGIYRRLLDLYYLDEIPLADNIPYLARRIRARENEKEIEVILMEFFEKTESGWTQARCNMEILEYHEICSRNKANGKQGGRPKKTQSVMSGLREKTQSDNSGNPDESQPVTSNQEPVTITSNTLSFSSTENNPETVDNLQKRNSIPYQQIVDIYHQVLPTLPKVEKLTTKRKGQIAARWRTDLTTTDQWRNYFDFVSQSKWLMGKVAPTNGRKLFRADIEWLTNETNFTKISENKYHG